MQKVLVTFTHLTTESPSGFYHVGCGFLSSISLLMVYETDLFAALIYRNLTGSNKRSAKFRGVAS